MKVTGAQLLESMKAVGATFVESDTCPKCSRMSGYTRDGDTVTFNSDCHCTERGGAKPVSWDEVAEWVNAHASERAAEQATKFGIGRSRKP